MSPKRLAKLEDIEQGTHRVLEVAAILRVARSTVYSLMERGLLQWVMVGRARRIPKAALKDFAARNLLGGSKLDDTNAPLAEAPELRDTSTKKKGGRMR